MDDLQVEIQGSSVFGLPATKGLIACITVHGTISLEQEEMAVYIHPWQIDTVIGWLQQLKSEIEGR